MAAGHLDPKREAPSGVSRRGALWVLGGWGLAGWGRSAWGQLSASQPVAASQAAEAIESSAGVEELPLQESVPGTAPAGGPRSIVADLHQPMVVSPNQVHEGALRGLIEQGLALATGQPTGRSAWQSLLKPTDTVGIKFDPYAQAELGVIDTLAEQLVLSLERAGWPRDRIVLIQVPVPLEQRLGTQIRKHGWRDTATPIGEAAERLAVVLDQVTALVNVPTLRHDARLGLCGCVKNISLPFVHRQLPYLRDAGTPHLARIAAMPDIAGRLRVNLVNALRVIPQGGPTIDPQQFWPRGSLLVSRDPVAADQVGVFVLNERRRALGLPTIGDAMGHLPHVRAAATLGLGTDDQDYIEIIRPTL